MRSLVIRSCVRWFGILCVLALASCGSDSPAGPPLAPGNRAPTIAAIADQTVIRNTIDPRAVEIELEIQDEDDESVTVRLDSDAGDVIEGESFTCVLTDPCVLSLTPAPHRTAMVNLRVTVSDDSGGEARASFRVSVLPRLVTAEDDDVPGSLRERVATADPGDVVGFDTDGFFAQPRTITLTDQIIIDQPLTIEGPGADALTVSGDTVTRVFKITAGADVFIRGLGIAEGRAAPELVGNGMAFVGGGILVDVGSRLTLSASTVSGSAAEAPFAAFGGGIANIGGTLIVQEGSRIAENRTTRAGGGIVSVDLPDAEALTIIENSVIENNVVTHNGGEGGGIYSRGKLVVDASTITRNIAATGGGVYSIDTELLVDASRITGNSAVDLGGGIYSNGEATVIRNRTIIENNEATHGGGIYVTREFTVEGDSEIRLNVAVESGGGVYYSAGAPASSEITAAIENSTIAGNFARRGGGIFYSYAHDSSSGVTNLHIRDGSLINLNTALEGAGIFQTQTFGTGGNARTLIDASEIVENAASGFSGGGGIMHEGGRLTIRSASSIRGNDAANGGGIFNRENAVESREVTTEIVSGTVTGNTASLAGGGVMNRTMLILRSGASITGNTALPSPGSGGGIYNIGTVVNSGNVTGNTPDDIAP